MINSISHFLKRDSVLALVVLTLALFAIPNIGSSQTFTPGSCTASPQEYVHYSTNALVFPGDSQCVPQGYTEAVTGYSADYQGWQSLAKPGECAELKPSGGSFIVLRVYRIPTSQCVQANTPPTATLSGPTTGSVGTSYTFSITGSDANSDTVRNAIDWTNDDSYDIGSPSGGFSASPRTEYFSYTWSSLGTYTIKGTTDDSKGASGSTYHTINIVAPTVDLKVNGVDGPVSVVANTSVNLSWTTTGNPASCTASGAWGGPKATGSGSEAQSVGTTQKTYTITCGSASDTVTVNINPPANTPPTATLSGPTTGQTNTPYTFTITGTDPEADQLKYYIDWDNNGGADEGNPHDNSVASGSGVPFTHSWSSQGSYTMRYWAVDTNVNLSSVRTHTITIASAPVPVVDLKVNGSDGPISVNSNTTVTLTWNNQNISSCTKFGGTWGSGGSLTPASSGSDTTVVAEATTYSISCNGYVDTVTVNINPPVVNGSCGSSNNSCSAGNLSDTADTATEYRWSCNGQNGGSSASCSANISTAPPPITGSCSATPSNVAVGTTVYWAASASGGNGSYSYSWSGSDSLSGNSSSVSKSYSTAGTKTASVMIISGADSKTLSCSNNVTVTSGVNQGPTTPTVTPGTCTVGSPVGFTMTASDQGTDQIQYEVLWNDGSDSYTSSLVNSGTTVNTSHTWSTAGSKAVNVRARDALGAVSSWATVYLNCTAPAAPTVTLEASVNGGSWSSADRTINVGDNVALRWTSGGVSNCTSYSGVGFNVFSTNGTDSDISEPAAGGSDNFNVSCSDGAGGSVDDNLTITTSATLANQPPTTPNVTPSTCTIGTPVTFTASASDPNGDLIRFGFDWDNNGTVDQPSSGYNYASVAQSVGYTWTTGGSKTIRVFAEDSPGLRSGWQTVTVDCGLVAIPQTVDLKVNGADSASVNAGTGFTLTWSSQGATSCNKFGTSWGSGESVGINNSAGDYLMLMTPGSHTYVLNCNGVVDSVTVNVISTASLPPSVNVNYSIDGGPFGNNFFNDMVTLQEGQQMKIRWSSNRADFCVKSFTPGNALVNDAGVDITEPAAGLPDWTIFTVYCENAVGADEKRIYVKVETKPNLYPLPVLPPVMGVYNSVNQTYDEMDFKFRILNGGSGAVTQETDYEFYFDIGNDGSYETSSSYNPYEIGRMSGSVQVLPDLSWNGPGGNLPTWREVTEPVAGPVPVGVHGVRIVADANLRLDESNESDNVYVGTVTVGAPNPGLSINADRTILRNGETTTIRWSVVNPYSGLSCKVYGPGVDISSAGTSGSTATAAIESKQEYTFICTDGISTWSDSIVVETTGIIEET